MKTLSKLFFFLCLPGIILHAPLKADIPQTFNGTEDYSNFSPWELLNYETLTVDNILNFVQMIEDTDNLEDIFTESQMEEIQEFLIFLMRNGIRDWDIEAKERLEEDIAWMRGEPNNSTLAYEDDDPPFWFGALNGYHGIKILPAILIPSKNPEIVLCRGKLKKFYKSCKRAAKRHKKEIIIAAIVVAATVVIIASGGTATPEAVAGGASAIAGVNESSKSKKDDDDERPRNPVNKPGEVYSRDDYPPSIPQDNSYPNGYAQNTSSIDSYRPQLEDIPKQIIPTKEIAQQQASEIKEELAEIIPDEVFVNVKDERSFWVSAAEKAKETGSHISHDVYEAVTDQLEIIPQVAGALSNNLPESLKNADPFDKDPRDSFHEMVEAGHEKIDKIFGTDQSDMYAAEGKAARGELTTGMLPPPGSIGNTKKSVNPVNRSNNHQYIAFVENGQNKVVSVGEMCQSGTIVDKGDLTKAGRSLQKHGARIDSAFPKPTGNTAEINFQGQKILEEILNHPEKSVYVRSDASSRMGHEVIDVRLPDGRGARFTKDGKEMICFLEPNQ